jgi:hypothetical protein
LVMLIVSGAALLVMGAFMGMPFLGMGLVFSIVYVWAKENADQEVNFVFNLAKFKAFYLPWAYVGLAMLMGQSPVPHLMGIAAGHFYVFVDKIVPAQYNRTLLWTPNFLCDPSFAYLQHSGCATRLSYVCPLWASRCDRRLPARHTHTRPNPDADLID